MPGLWMFTNHVSNVLVGTPYRCSFTQLPGKPNAMTPIAHSSPLPMIADPAVQATSPPSGSPT
jgi:hypothetical protein